MSVALENSISSFEKIRDVSDFFYAKLGATPIPLCDSYWEGNCQDCPVKKRTNQMDCQGTPVETLLRMTSKSTMKRPAQWWMEWRKVCQREIEFLKSLRDAS